MVGGGDLTKRGYYQSGRSTLRLQVRLGPKEMMKRLQPEKSRNTFAGEADIRALFQSGQVGYYILLQSPTSSLVECHAKFSFFIH